MKKFLCCLFLVSSIFLLVGCAGDYKYKNNLTQYNMELEYNDETKCLSGKQTVSYINSSDNTLSCVKFHLYANAFRENAKASVVSLSNVVKAYPNGKSYGNIDITQVKVGEENAQFLICGEDENILEVTLLSPLYPDDRVEIYMEYNVKLANINHRLGYGNNAVNLCNFYPIACVYEGDEFMCDMYNSNGDPFYSEVADYNVVVTYPQEYTLASSGEKTDIKENGKICSKIQAKCVRDFGMVLSNKFECETQNYDEGRIKINYYYYDDESPTKTLKIIDEALSFFEKNIGKYPYNQISVVETNFVHGGMEYPNLVLISDSAGDYSTYQMVVVHELCHQWWYGVVGNNQFDYGWIDEGLTEFCTVLFFENHPQYDRSMENMIMSATYSYTTFMKVYTDVQGKVDTSMNRALDEYKTEPEYVYNTYVKGMLMFSTIYEVTGQKAFTRALKHYYKENMFEFVTPGDVVKDFSYGTGRNLENLFNSWLEGKVKIIGK